MNYDMTYWILGAAIAVTNAILDYVLYYRKINKRLDALENGDFITNLDTHNTAPVPHEPLRLTKHVE